jgi:hypothetical protein
VGLRPYFRLLDLITREKPATTAEETFWTHMPRLSRVWRKLAAWPYYFVDGLDIYRKSAAGTTLAVVALALFLFRKFGSLRCLRIGAIAGSALILLLVVIEWVRTPAKAALPKPHIAVKVDPKVFDAYAGRYSVKLPRESTLTIKRDGGALLAQVGSNFPEQLFPESETAFFNSMESAEITFVRNEKGEVTGVTVTANGKTQLGEKLEGL